MRARGRITPLDAYHRRAQALLTAFQSGQSEAELRVKWEHPRFRGQPLAAVKGAVLSLDDARTVVAREHGFTDWPHLASFVDAVAGQPGVRRFEEAVDALVNGDEARLRALLDESPGLVYARSARRHHATLLHYLAANGVEAGRQKTPPNALTLMRLLLQAGAAPDALADFYDHQCTTMSLLVSSSHPAAAGVQAAMAELLLDHGAALEGRGSEWTSALMTALTFGFPDTARTLVRRGAPVDTLPAAAGLGLADETARLLPAADDTARRQAMALAAQLGHADVVALLLDAGVPSDRFNPDGFHSHATPLHHAALHGHADVVRVMIDRGARLDVRDTIYDATPLGWAVHGGQMEMAAYLRERGAP